MKALRAIAAFLALVVLCVALSPSDAEAQRRRRRRSSSSSTVSVEVVDVSGGRAYVAPGETAGVGRGSEIRIGSDEYVVVAATDGWAAFDLPEGATVAVGASGRASLVIEAGETAPRLPPPSELAAFEGAWPEVVLPSSTQSPDPVPLGRTGTARRAELAASTTMTTIIPLEEEPVLFRGDLRVRGRVAPFDGIPLWVTGDVSGQLWAADDLGTRDNGDSRPPLRVRELTVAFGRSNDISDFYAAIGRIRSVAMQLGQLDGIAIRTPSLEGFTVGAFGGLVPDPTLGLPSLAAQRFGLELAYRDPDSELRPSIGIVAHGSVFDGAVDERRLNVIAQIFPDVGRLGAHAELSLHDAVNPWNVSEVELSAAGVDGGIRVDDFDVGARFDVRRPERSRWLASFLPTTYLCVPAPQTPDVGVVEPCSGADDSRYAGTVDVGLRMGNWALRGGANFLHYVQDPTLGQIGGFASVRAAPLVETVRADLFLSAATGAVYDTMAGRLTLGWAIVPDMIDLSAHYRIGYSIYRADFEGWLEHMAGGSLVVTPLPELAITLVGDGITGRDVDVLLLQLSAIYRPSF